VGAANRSAFLEATDFVILAEELDSQDAAIGRLIAECHRLGFAYRLPGPLRQLEELKYHIKVAAALARDLTAGAFRPAASGGDTNDR
jgi:hypothetical protein